MTTARDPKLEATIVALMAWMKPRGLEVHTNSWGALTIVLK